MDIPDTGAIFTLGKSHLAENSQSYFFIKNDPVQRLISGFSQSAVICGTKEIEIEFRFKSHGKIESGRLFVWGENQFGQLGTSSSNGTEIVTKPTCVKSLKTLGLKAQDVAFGLGWSVILTNTNEIFFTGRNIFSNETKAFLNFTETTIAGEVFHVTRKPFRLEEFDGMIGDNKEDVLETLSAGNDHFVVLSSSGRLFGWGNNEFNQLGITENKLNLPIEIALDDPVKEYTCGPTSTLVLTEKNQLFVTGILNEFHFPRFTELSLNSFPQEQITFLHISQTSEIFIITENGAIYKTSESIRNKSLIFQKFYDYDNEDNGPAVKLLKGTSFFAALTRKNKFYTTFSESGHHLKTFREISKFKNLRTLDLAVGDKHVLVLGIPKSAKIPDNRLLNRTYTIGSDLNGNLKSLANVGRRSQMITEEITEEKEENDENIMKIDDDDENPGNSSSVIENAVQEKHKLDSTENPDRKEEEKIPIEQKPIVHSNTSTENETEKAESSDIENSTENASKNINSGIQHEEISNNSAADTGVVSTETMTNEFEIKENASTENLQEGKILNSPKVKTPVNGNIIQDESTVLSRKSSAKSFRESSGIQELHQQQQQQNQNQSEILNNRNSPEKNEVSSDNLHSSPKKPDSEEMKKQDVDKFNEVKVEKTKAQANGDAETPNGTDDVVSTETEKELDKVSLNSYADSLECPANSPENLPTLTNGDIEAENRNPKNSSRKNSIKSRTSLKIISEEQSSVKSNEEDIKSIKTPGSETHPISKEDNDSPKESESGKSGKGSARSIKFDERSLKSEKSQNNLARPRTPFPNESQTTPSTVKRAPNLTTENEVSEKPNTILTNSLEHIPETIVAPMQRRPSLKYVDRGLKKEKVDEITRKLTLEKPVLIKEKYIDFEDSEKDDELIVEIKSRGDPLDKTMVNEIRFINNGIDVTDKVEENLSSAPSISDVEADLLGNDPSKDYKVIGTKSMKQITQETIMKTPEVESVSKEESKPKTGVEDDERTTASVNSNISANPSENVSEASDKEKVPLPNPEIESVSEIVPAPKENPEEGKVKRFINDLKIKGKEMSCRSDRSVQVEDEPPKYTPVDENLEKQKTSKICIIL